MDASAAVAGIKSAQAAFQVLSALSIFKDLWPKNAVVSGMFGPIVLSIYVFMYCYTGFMFQASRLHKGIRQVVQIYCFHFIIWCVYCFNMFFLF